MRHKPRVRPRAAWRSVSDSAHATEESRIEKNGGRDPQTVDTDCVLRVSLVILVAGEHLTKVLD